MAFEDLWPRTSIFFFASNTFKKSFARNFIFLSAFLLAALGMPRHLNKIHVQRIIEKA